MPEEVRFEPADVSVGCPSVPVPVVSVSVDNLDGAGEGTYPVLSESIATGQRKVRKTAVRASITNVVDELWGPPLMRLIESAQSLRGDSNRRASQIIGIPYPTYLLLKEGRGRVTVAQLLKMASYVDISPPDLLKTILLAGQPTPSIPLRRKVAALSLTEQLAIAKEILDRATALVNTHRLT